MTSELLREDLNSQALCCARTVVSPCFGTQRPASRLQLEESGGLSDQVCHKVTDRPPSP
jgi:hypothetical protein